jgi:hypothetical protein
MVRDVVHLLLDIRLAGDGFATPGERDLRSRLVTLIEGRGIGEVGGFGSGAAGMDVSVIVDDEARGRAELIELMREVAPEAAFTIEPISDEDDA